MYHNITIVIALVVLIVSIKYLCICHHQMWSGPERLLALDELIDRCETGQVKHMMQVIEPQFQRDFISLLPKEVKPRHAVT